MKRGLLAAVVSLALAAGCDASSASQILVEVVDGTDGRLVVPDDFDAFEIEVATVLDDTAGERVRYQQTFALAGPGIEGGLTLPQSLVVEPATDGTGTVRVRVLGLRGGATLQRIERTATFGPGLNRLPPFALSPLCAGVDCPPGENCEEGVCVAPAPCETTGTCPDAGVPDAGGCGAGSVVCPMGCVPSDDANCSACGVACPTGERCISSTCACGVGLARCGVRCVDLSRDPTSCGACGRTCAPSAECRDGVCNVVSCPSGLADCNGRPDDGCEGSCATGARCDTGCGDGTLECGDICSPVCRPPGEMCNWADDDCNGACDDLAGCRVPIHRAWSESQTDHLYTRDLGAAMSAPYTLEGAGFFFTYAASPTGSTPLYRCSITGSATTFLTLDSGCEGAGAVVETLGQVARSPVCGAVPLYRLYIAANQDHFYTISAVERDGAVTTFGAVVVPFDAHVFLTPGG